MTLHVVHLSDSDSVINGLDSMLTAAIGPHGYVFGYVEMPVALLILEVAKRAEDRAEWFPRGKWATIQAIEERINVAFKDLWTEAP